MVRAYKFSYKKGFLIILILFSIAIYLVPISLVYAQNPIGGFIMIDGNTNEVLYEQNADQRLKFASTTKIITAIIVIENCENLNRCVKIQPSYVGIEGSSIYLRTNEQFRIIDLLYGLMLRSGNDAAVALANITCGSEEQFVEQMNALAIRLKANDTHFDNAHGLDGKNHYTTARDLAILTAYAMKNPIFRKIVGTKHYTFDRNGQTQTFINKNKLLSNYEGAEGVKTGYTKASGRCLVASCYKCERRLIAVALNCNDTYNKCKSMFDMIKV